MQVPIKLLGALRKSLPEGQEQTVLDVPEGATVKGAILAAGVPEGKTWNASIDGILVYEDTILKPGDSLIVFPPISGG